MGLVNKPTGCPGTYLAVADTEVEELELSAVHSMSEATAWFDGPELRMARRAELREEVIMESGHHLHLGAAENVSVGGLFVATYDLQALGDVVELEFTLSDGIDECIRVRGEVRWVRQYNSRRRNVAPGLGLRFLDLRPEDLRRIERFVRFRSPS